MKTELFRAFLRFQDVVSAIIHIMFACGLLRLFRFLPSYRPHPRDGEGNVFTSVCLCTWARTAVRYRLHDCCIHIGLFWAVVRTYDFSLPWTPLRLLGPQATLETFGNLGALDSGAFLPLHPPSPLGPLSASLASGSLESLWQSWSLRLRDLAPITPLLLASLALPSPGDLEQLWGLSQTQGPQAT